MCLFMSVYVCMDMCVTSRMKPEHVSLSDRKMDESFTNDTTDDLNESDNSNNSDESLIPSWACCQTVKNALDRDFRGPSSGTKVTNSY